MKIKRRFPNYFSGFEETEHEVNDYEELMQIDWVKNVIDIGDKLEYSPPTFTDNPNFLMAIHSPSSYFVIGYIFGDPKDLGLKKWRE